MLIGAKIQLRPACERDRQQVFNWLTSPEIAPAMMGEPDFPDHPIPSWAQFCEDYAAHYFEDSEPTKGRCFIIVLDGADVGVVSYNQIRSDKVTDMDIWMRSASDCGRGSGVDAIKTLIDYLSHQLGVHEVVIAPSARNVRAISAYRKAGFEHVAHARQQHYIREYELDYADAVVMVRNCSSAQR